MAESFVAVLASPASEWSAGDAGHARLHARKPAPIQMLLPVPGLVHFGPLRRVRYTVATGS